MSVKTQDFSEDFIAELRKSLEEQVKLQAKINHDSVTLIKIQVELIDKLLRLVPWPVPSDVLKEEAFVVKKLEEFLTLSEKHTAAAHRANSFWMMPEGHA